MAAVTCIRLLQDPSVQPSVSTQRRYLGSDQQWPQSRLEPRCDRFRVPICLKFVRIIHDVSSFRHLDSLCFDVQNGLSSDRDARTASAAGSRSCCFHRTEQRVTCNFEQEHGSPISFTINMKRKNFDLLSRGTLFDACSSSSTST